MDRDQKLELQALVNNAMDLRAERIHQISGTSEDDVCTDGKPWE